MWFVYVIESIPCPGYFYKGHSKDIEVRLVQHNKGKTQSTKDKIPFKLVYLEQFDTLQQAVQREKYFKSSAGRRFLKARLGSH